MGELFTTEFFVAFLQVVMIDLALAGDNAIVIGLAAAGLPPAQRSRAILVGIIAATVLRIAFAGVTTQLLQIVGLLFGGGVLLLWVCWKMWREIRMPAEVEEDAAEALADFNGLVNAYVHGNVRAKEQFISSHAKNREVHLGHAGKLPIIRRLFDGLVDAFPIREHPRHQSPGKLPRPFISFKVTPKKIERGG